MSASKDIPVCILAGGASRRFGSNKAFALLGKKPLIAHALDRVRAQTQAPMAINCENPGPFAEFGLPIALDRKWAGQGPLSGILAALNWAKTNGFVEVATVAVDLPCLPCDLLSAFSSEGAPTIAASNGRSHPVNGLWNTTQIKDLDAYLESGRRSAQGWAESCKAREVSFHADARGFDPFYNINTPADLERIAAEPAVDR